MQMQYQLQLWDGRENMYFWVLGYQDQITHT